MTILLTPFMSCSAKIPIYGVFSAAFFPNHAALVMIGLYILGILVGIVAAKVLGTTVYKGNPVPFVMELPNYRFPSAKSVWQLCWDKAKDFLTRAFTIIFVATIIVWFLQTFDTRLNLVDDSADSLLATVGAQRSPSSPPLESLPGPARMSAPPPWGRCSPLSLPPGSLPSPCCTPPAWPPSPQ